MDNIILIGVFTLMLLYFLFNIALFVLKKLLKECIGCSFLIFIIILLFFCVVT